MKSAKLLSMLAFALAGAATTTPAQAQLQQIGIDPAGFPICAGPLGPGRCADILAWMQRGGMTPHGPSFPAPPAPGFPGPAGPMGLPTSVVTHDGQLAAQIAQACNGEPRCIAAAWATEEFRRCSNGIGAPGGCFGPNGEIMRVINSTLNDIRNGGVGRGHDVFGADGWVCETLLGGCD